MTAVTYRQEMRRCGKPSCRRCREGAGHGPYWYAYWREEDGRLRSRYVGKECPPEAHAPDQASTDPPALHVCMLGGFEVVRGVQALRKSDWPRSDARKLLALLLLHPGGMAREEALEALWPDRAPHAAETALRTALSTLRRILEPARIGRPQGIVPTGSCAVTGGRLPTYARKLCLYLLPGDWIDVHDFEVGDLQTLEVGRLVELVGLYQGDLLPEYRYEDWTASRREALRLRWQSLTLTLARRLLDTGQDAAAIARLEALLRDDPTQEAAAQLLMHALAESGRRDEALRVYARLCVALKSELEVEPDAHLKELAGRLRRESTGAATPHESPAESAARLRRHMVALTAEPANPGRDRRLARLWAEHALALDGMGEPEEALTSVESGWSALGGLDAPPEMARLLLAASTIHQRQGVGTKALVAAEEAGRLADRAGERALTARALRLQAMASQHLRRLEDAIALARASVALYETLGAALEALRSRSVLALSVWYSGRYPEAVRLYRRNLADAQSLGDPERVAYALCGLGSALRAVGEIEAGERYLHEAHDRAERLQDGYLRLSAAYHLANLWVDRAFLNDMATIGDDPAAKGEVDRDAGRSDHMASPAPGAGSRGDGVLRARLEAISRFEWVIREGREQASHHMSVYAALDAAGALASWGDVVRARGYLASARRELDQIEGDEAARAWALLTEAEVVLAERDSDRAMVCARDAIPLLEQSSPPGLAQAYRVAARATVAHTNANAAAPHWTASLAAAVACGQRIEELRTRAAMAAAGVSAGRP